MAVVVGKALLVNFIIGLPVKALRKDGDDKDVDEEGDEESDRRLNEEVLVGLTHRRSLPSINIAGFHLFEKELRMVFFCPGKNILFFLLISQIFKQWYSI